MAKTDKKTLDLIAQVKKQKDEIAKIERPNWKTHCSLEGVPGLLTRINLHVESNINVLAHSAGVLVMLSEAYTKGAAALGIEAPPFRWCDYDLASWLDDIKLRVDRLQISTKKKKLELLETRLKAVISPELKAEMELDEIEKELS